MRAETIHVTDHAMLRWKERASRRFGCNVENVIKAVKSSRIIKKDEPLPYPMPRKDGSVYSFYGGIMFILESISIDEYNLITVISEKEIQRSRPHVKNTPVKHTIDRKRTKDKIEKLDDPEEIDLAKEERIWLAEEIKRLKKKKEKGVDYGDILIKILTEIREIRAFIENSGSQNILPMPIGEDSAA